MAAAIAAEAPVIVTFNLGDLPEEAVAPHGIRAQHPDDFACELLDESRQAFLLAVRTHRAALKHPPKTVEEYLAALVVCGLTKTAARIAAHRDEM